MTITVFYLNMHVILFLGTSATLDSSSTSTDRDLSIESRSSVHKNNKVIDALQTSYEIVIPGRNIDTANDVHDNITTKEAYVQQESDHTKVDEVDACNDTAQMEEEPTTAHSTRTVVAKEDIILATNVHSQDHSGSQSVSETVPTQAQDPGSLEVPATTAFKTTFNNPPVDGSTTLVIGNPAFPSIPTSG